MALLKNFIDERGMQTTYHRINSLTVYPTYIVISIDSYASEEYRLLEKEFYEVTNKISEIESTLLSINPTVMGQDEEGQEIVVEDNTDTVHELQTELQELLDKRDAEHSNMALSSCTISTPFNVDLDNFGFSQIYSIIKENELFKGAEDC